MHPRFPLAVIAALLAGGDAHSQQLLWSQGGDSTSSAFAGLVRVAGDVDGDGVDDLMTGDPDSSPVFFLDGRVTVHSGVDGAVIHTLDGASPLQGLGVGIDGVGDIDGDGRADFVVASHEAAPVVYSGADASVLHVLDAAGTSNVLSAAGAGDVNADGVPDVIVGSSLAASFNGRAWVFSGAFMADGTPPELLHVFDGQASGSGSLLTVDGAGDVDADGHADLIVGQHAESGPGYCGIARVWSGESGALIRAHLGPAACSGYGFSVASAGDLDGDGHAEVVVGAPFDDTNGSNAGAAYAYSGADGALMHAWLGKDASDQLGRPVDGAGDVNGDHVPDVLVGAPVDETADGGGALWIFSGLDGSVLTVMGEAGGGYGIAAAGGADLDGDDLADFAVGASGPANGRLYAYAGLCTGANHGYCTAAPNSHSATGGSITAAGSTSISAGDLTLLARECPPNQSGVFFYGTQQQEIPFGDGTLCVGGAFFRLRPVVAVDPGGIATLPVDFTAAPLGDGPGAVEAGDTRFFSFWFRDPTGGPVGFNYTNGRVLTFCP